MAESEQQVQSLDTPEGEDDEAVSNYKPPAKKSLDEIESMDKDDESLVKYKQTLLGQKTDPPFPDDERNVIVKSLSLLVTEHEDKVLDLQGDISKLKDTPFTIKEGASYKLKIEFFVQREIVSGLRYSQNVTRKGIKVDKSNLMMGSYGPKKDVQCFLTPLEEAPKGMLSRGSYSVHSMFLDDDKNEIMKWNWKFDIKKEWDDKTAKE